jgi:hypothetical protein
MLPGTLGPALITTNIHGSAVERKLSPTKLAVRPTNANLTLAHVAQDLPDRDMPAPMMMNNPLPRYRKCRRGDADACSADSIQHRCYYRLRAADFAEMSRVSLAWHDTARCGWSTTGFFAIGAITNLMMPQTITPI